MLLVFYATLRGLVAVLIVSVAQLATLLPNYSRQVIDLLDQITAWLADLGVERDQISGAIGRFDLVGMLQ